MSSTSLTIEQRLDRLYSRSQANGLMTSHDPHSGILDWRPASKSIAAAATPAPLLKKARHRPRPDDLNLPKVDEEAIAKLKRSDDEQVSRIFAEMTELSCPPLSPVVVHAGCARSRQFVASLQKTTFEQALSVARTFRQRLGTGPDNDDDSSGLDDSDEDDDDYKTPKAPEPGVVGGTVCAPLPEEMPVKISPRPTSSPDLPKISTSAPMDLVQLHDPHGLSHRQDLGRDRERRPSSPLRRESSSTNRRPSSDRSCSRRDDDQRRDRRSSSRRSSSEWNHREQHHRHRSRSPARSRRYSPDRRKSEPDLPPAPPRQRPPTESTTSSSKIACSPSAATTAASSAVSPSLGASMASPTVGQSNQSMVVEQSVKWKDAVKLKRLADKMKKEAPLSDGWVKRQEMYMSAGLKFLEAAEMFSCGHSYQNTAQYFENIIQMYIGAGCQFFASIGYECRAVALYRAMLVKRKDLSVQSNQLLAHIRAYQSRTAAAIANSNAGELEPLTFPSKLGEILSSYLRHSRCAFDYMDDWDKAKAYRPGPDLLKEHNLEVLESLDRLDMAKFIEHVRRALSSSFMS